MDKKQVKAFNIITLGDSGVGKTSIINRYITNKFEDNMTSSIGLNFSYKEIHFNNKDKIILKLVDTAGQEKYRSLTKSYYKNTDAVLFVFSMNDKDSFDSIRFWIDLFKYNNTKDAPKYLVGNKNDLEINIDQSLIDEFMKENKVPFISISAKENNNIDELFEEIGKKLYIDYLKKGGYTEQDSIKIKIITKKKIVAFIKKMTYNLVIIV